MDIKVPGAFIEHKPSFDIGQSLDDHMRMVEVEYVTQRQSKSPASGSSQIPKPLSQNRVRRTEEIGKRASLIRSNPELRERKLVQEFPDVIDKEPATIRSNPELRGLDHNSTFTLSSVAEKISPPVAKLDSSRLRRFMFVHHGHTTVTSEEARPRTAEPTHAVKVDSQVKVLRPLSLGDISSGIRDLFQ